MTLSAANSYTGCATLGFGTLSVGNNSALSTGSLVFNGGTLQAASSGIALSNTSYSVSANNAPGTIGGTGDNITLNGTVTLYSGSTLSISNTGTTTLGVVNGSASGSGLLPVSQVLARLNSVAWWELPRSTV